MFDQIFNNFIGNIVDWVLSLFDTVLAFFAWLLPDYTSSEFGNSLQSAIDMASPYLFSLNQIFPLDTLFGILSFVFFIEISLLFFFLAVFIWRAIRG